MTTFQKFPDRFQVFPHVTGKSKPGFQCPGNTGDLQAILPFNRALLQGGG